ncbi:MAG: SUMF1/EgtB/PvdO family nonheme iron enzyme [Planctomycetaceae bacterium]|nr:SUMF1/EgtB/PvdO family nonheme iron enzyme [Planctomycetaceae bacterium]
MAVTIEEFIQKLTESGVMLGDEITAFHESHTADTAEDFADTLIQNKKLTKYQAQQILQGKANGLLLGDYLILDTIGAGGMGQVYLAEHRRMGRQVALKTLPESVAKDLQKIKRFQREVRAAAKLSHPNVVTAYDAGEDKGVHYFVMECVDGIDLSQLVKQQGTLPVAQAVNFVLQAAKGLKYAHSKGIVHRDIKPANMLLDSEGTVKLLDMGLARINSLDEEVAEIDLTSTGMVMGTVDYMAPEQAVDTKQADARSDIYSLGCMLHYLMTGKSVYGGDTMVKKIFAHRDQPIPSLSATRSGIPSALDVLFQKMVAKDPNDRQQSMSEVISELQTCGVLEPSLESGSATAFSNAPAFDRSLKDQVTAATLTISQPSTEQAPTTDEKGTLPSIVLDETIAITGIPSRSKRHKTSSPRRLWPIVASCLLGTVGLFVAAGIFLKVDTREGTVIIEIDQPELAGAVVSVDGQKKITIKTGEGKEPIEIAADEKTHTLKVTKGGFETFTKQFTVKAGGNQTIKVRLEPLAVAKPIPNESSMPKELTTHVWPKNQPAPAIAPFNAEQARDYQEAWAKHLGVEVETTNSIGMKFRVIPPGEFLMGSSEEEIAKLLEEAKELKTVERPESFIDRIPDEGPQHKVTLTKPFEVSIHEVTRGQFRKFVEQAKHKTDAEQSGKGGMGWRDGEWIQSPEFLWNTVLGFDTEQTDDHPVVNVSWNDAVAFCEWLSKKEGVPYRLPTEAEWEFACRAGSLARYSWGDEESFQADYAWSAETGGNQTNPVGQKKSNALGLFDLYGNVWEWCNDRNRPYTTEALIDPVGTSQGNHRATRGGQFSNPSSTIRSAARWDYRPDFRTPIGGFRVVSTFDSAS